MLQVETQYHITSVVTAMLNVEPCFPPHPIYFQTDLASSHMLQKPPCQSTHVVTAMSNVEGLPSTSLRSRLRSPSSFMCSRTLKKMRGGGVSKRRARGRVKDREVGPGHVD